MEKDTILLLDTAVRFSGVYIICMMSPDEPDESDESQIRVDESW